MQGGVGRWRGGAWATELRVGWGYGLFFGLVEVVFVQDVGVRKDVAQEPAQCGFAARGTAADADDRCFPLIAGHQVGLLGEVGFCTVFPEEGV